MQRDIQEMLASYKLLLLAAECFLELHRPLILSATFSRCSYHEMLARLLGKHPDVQLKLLLVLSPRTIQPMRSIVD